MESRVRTTLVMGKGGVGKTTVAAGIALRSALDGRPAYFVEFSDGRSGRRLLRQHPEVRRRVYERYEAIREMATELIGSEWLTRLVLQNFAIKKMMRAAPAIGELALLDAVLRLGQEHHDAHVVVDMPATGHGLSWLKVPSRMARVLQRGPLYRTAERVRQGLLSSDETEVVVVTLPERVVLSETVELCEKLQVEVGMVTPRLIVNRAPLFVTDEVLEETQTLAHEHAHARAYAEYFRYQREQAEEDLQILSGTTVAVRAFDLQADDPTAQEVADWLNVRYEEDSDDDENVPDTVDSLQGTT